MIKEDNREEEELYRKYLKQAVDLALKDFMHMKQQEGAQLQTDISNRMKKIHGWIKSIESKTPFAAQKFREKLIARLREFTGAN